MSNYVIKNNTVKRS